MLKYLRIARQIARKTHNLTGNIREHGLVSSYRLYKYRVYEQYRDWLLGVKTSGDLTQLELGHTSECMPYQAVNYRCLDNMFSTLDIDPARDVFLDYGCGKGRAVAVAATLPFRRVIGIELSAGLAEAASANVKNIRAKRRCSDVEIVNCDATQFTPPADANVIFFFNPFRGEVLEGVQNQLLNSFLANPREMTIVYMNPAHEPDLFAGCTWLQWRCNLATADWDQITYRVYCTTPQLSRLQPAVGTPERRGSGPANPVW